MFLSEQPSAAAPSRWLQRWRHLLRPGARVLDVACGRGRNLRWLVDEGYVVTGVDRDAQALAPLSALGERVEIVVADLEQGPWPFPGRRFDAVLVTHYLWRPLLPTLVDSLAEGGMLVYETFADGQQTIGRPACADFLLQPGELLQACAGLRIIAFEDGFIGDFEGGGTDGLCASRPCYVQRIVAARQPLPHARFELPETPESPTRADR
ncbi:MAG TPA: class I SAM-dependent methyltransferase [Rubrivivax sp.]|nr:class I SAM-dependent methyltransferase [Rubrivivax sp.]